VGALTTEKWEGAWEKALWGEANQEKKEKRKRESRGKDMGNGELGLQVNGKEKRRYGSSSS